MALLALDSRVPRDLASDLESAGSNPAASQIKRVLSSAVTSVFRKAASCARIGVASAFLTILDEHRHFEQTHSEKVVDYRIPGDSSQSSATGSFESTIQSLNAIGEPSSIGICLASGSHSIGPLAPREPRRVRMFGDHASFVASELSSESSPGTCTSLEVRLTAMISRAYRASAIRESLQRYAVRLRVIILHAFIEDEVKILFSCDSRSPLTG